MSTTYRSNRRQAHRKAYRKQGPPMAVLPSMHLDEMCAEVLGHLFERVWPVPVRGDTAVA